MNGVLETPPAPAAINLPIEAVVEDVMVDLGRLFDETVLTFARGSKLRREGRAPYLHILRWLADSKEWSLDLSEAMNTHPEHKASIGQVLDKNYLVALISDPDKKMLADHFHFEPSTSILSVEDTKLIFYLKNIIWRAFTRRVGFTTDYFESKYDFALSFAGADRPVARRLSELLAEREVVTFYDENEQHRILAQSIEKYLAPIYSSEARYVVPLLSTSYPTRIWTKFESDNFKERFGDNAVIPIRFTNTQPGYFSDDQNYGGVNFDPAGDVETQLKHIADLVCKRLVEDRTQSATKLRLISKSLASHRAISFEEEPGKSVPGPPSSAPYPPRRALATRVAPRSRWQLRGAGGAVSEEASRPAAVRNQAASLARRFRRAGVIAASNIACISVRCGSTGSGSGAPSSRRCPHVVLHPST